MLDLYGCVCQSISRFNDKKYATGGCQLRWNTPVTGYKEGNVASAQRKPLAKQTAVFTGGNNM